LKYILKVIDPTLIAIKQTRQWWLSLL